MTTPQISPSLQHDATRSQMEISEAHRAQLAKMIGASRAMADSYTADAVGNPPQADQLNAEAKRCVDRARLLEQRLGLLLQEMHGVVAQAATAQPAPRLPWQRPEWWALLDQIGFGVNVLASNADTYSARVGMICLNELRTAAGLVGIALGSKPSTPEGIANADLGSLIGLLQIVDKIAPTPWHLLDVDPQQGAQLVLMAQQLVKDLPPEPSLARGPKCIEVQRRLSILADSMQGHAEAMRLARARRAFDDGAPIDAVLSDLMGIVPPEPLSYELNQVARMVATLGADGTP